MGDNEDVFVEFSEETAKYFDRLLMNKMDTNEDGYISPEELEECLVQLAIDMDYFANNRDMLLDSVIQLFDKNGDKRLSIDEITTNLHAMQLYMSRETQELTEAFRVFDTNGDGYVTEKTLLKVLQVQNGMTLEEAAATCTDLMRFDKDGDGKFSYPEFIRFYCNLRFPFKAPENVSQAPIHQRYRMEKMEDQSGN